MCMKNNLLNCWESPKLDTLQHSHETETSAKAAKAEKSIEIAQGQILNAEIMGNQQRSPE